MTTDDRSIMLARIRGDSWRTITDTYRCSRTTIDKAARVLRGHRVTAETLHRLMAPELAESFLTSYAATTRNSFSRISP